MKKFMKTAALLMALLMTAMVFAGCDSSTSSDTSSTDTASASMTITEGKLVMATNAEFPPYEYYEGDTIVGIDAEVAQLLADKLGLELEIVDIDFNSIVPGVQTAKYDMGMAGMTVTKDRLKKVNFSDSYATGIQVVIVPEDSDIKSPDDLAGKKIGVQEATTGDIYASDDFGEENVVKYQNGALAIEGLKGGKVDCVIIDNEPAKAYVAANTGLSILETEYTVEDYAICINKDNKELLNKINAAMAELVESGEFQKVVDKYIK